MTGQAKAALLAAVMLAVVRTHWIVGQVFALAAMREFSPIYLGRLLGNVLFLLSLPILLFILFRSQTTLIPSRGLRLLALVTAVVLGLGFTVPALYVLAAKLVQDLSHLHWFPGPTVAARVWNG